jgi:hypothetical protein
MERFELDGPLLASLVHGGGTDGSNIVMFRRESIIGPDGTPTRVPMMSGNGFRGVLRRAGAWLLADDLGVTDGGLTRRAVQILASGGSLHKETAPSVAVMAALRRVPHLSLFGWSGAGSIHAGSLVVGKVVPVCAETAGLTGVESDVRAGQLLDLEQFTRHDSTGGIEGDPTDGDSDDDGGSNQMIYQVETLAAGTRLVGFVGLRPWATPADRWWLHRTINAWAAQGGHLGGRSATGHGRWAVEWAHETPDRPAEVLDNAGTLEALKALG